MHSYSRTVPKLDTDRDTETIDDPTAFKRGRHDDPTAPKRGLRSPVVLETFRLPINTLKYSSERQTERQEENISFVGREQQCGGADVCSQHAELGIDGISNGLMAITCFMCV
jgi:hypothetical protein